MIEGTIKWYINANTLDVDNHFILKPFPQKSTKNQDPQQIWSAYRHRINRSM